MAVWIFGKLKNIFGNCCWRTRSWTATTFVLQILISYKSHSLMPGAKSLAILLFLTCFFEFMAFIPIDSCAARNRPWRALAFLPLLTSSFLTQIGIIYTQLLQEEKIFPLIPRSEWSAEWSLRYALKCSKSWAKNSDQNFLPLHLAAPW